MKFLVLLIIVVVVVTLLLRARNRRLESFNTRRADELRAKDERRHSGPKP